MLSDGSREHAAGLLSITKKTEAMSKLTAKARKNIKGKNFALPNRRYPIEDKNHAKAALSMVSRYGTPAEKATVRRKVKSKYGLGGLKVPK